jgi:hypothetical protein
MISIESFNW